MKQRRNSKVLQPFFPMLTGLIKIFILLLYLPLNVQANDSNVTANGSSTLEQVVVTGARAERDLKQSTYAIEIIDNPLEKSTLDLLRSHPGIRLKPLHGEDGYEFQLSGFDSSQVLLTIDGIAAVAPGQALNINDLMSLDIERIEIVKGAGASLYGSQAMAGVINIVTNKSQTEKKWLALEHSQSVQQQSLIGDNEVSAAYSHYLADVYFNHTLAYQQYSNSKADSDDHTAFGSGGYRFFAAEEIGFANSLLNLSWQKKHLVRPFSALVGISLQDKDKIEDEEILNAKFELQFDNHLTQLNYKNEKFHSVQDVIATEGQKDFYRDTESNFIQFNHQSNFSIMDMQLVLGAYSHYEDLSQAKTQYVIGAPKTEQELAGEKSSIELFSHLEKNWNNRFIVSVGSRQQWDSNFGDFFSPSLSARNNINKELYILASVALGYRVPTLKERHYEFDHSIYGYKVMGNTDLQPEQSVSTLIELGTKFQQHKLTINLFNYDFSNLIITELDNSINNGLRNYVYQNINEVHSYGFDFSIQSVWSRPINWSLNVVKNISIDQQTQQAVAERAEDLYSANLSYQNQRLGKFNINANAQANEFYQDPDDDTKLIKSPDFSTIDFSWQKQFYSDWHINLAVNNLLNVTKDIENSSDSRPDNGLQLSTRLLYQP